jgi:hypothetical protein
MRPLTKIDSLCPGRYSMAYGHGLREQDDVAEVRRCPRPPTTRRTRAPCRIGSAEPPQTRIRSHSGTIPHRSPRSTRSGRDQPEPTPSVDPNWSQTNPHRSPRSSPEVRDHPTPTPAHVPGWFKTTPQRPPPNSGKRLNRSSETCGRLPSAPGPPPRSRPASAARFSTTPISIRGRSRMVATIQDRPPPSTRNGCDHSDSIEAIASDCFATIWEAPHAHASAQQALQTDA